MVWYFDFMPVTKISFQEANQRFQDQGRNDIQLCEDGFIGWTKKSKFYDLIVNEYFTAIPQNVYKQKSGHPLNKFKKMKKSIQEKYGVDNISKLADVVEKRKQTCLKKFGVDNPIKCELIREKMAEHSLKKYGVQHPISSLLIKEKIKKSCLKKYGVDHIPNKNVKKIIDSNQTMLEWYNTLSNPNISYQTVRRFFKNNNSVSLRELNELISTYNVNKTSLETLGEQVFSVQHFNKRILKSNMQYRPDFKLSETIFVNVDGLYWHGEHKKPKSYHFEMRKKYEENNLRLFQFYENEVKNKSEIIKSIVNDSLGRTSIIFIKNDYIIKIITQDLATQFLCDNCLSGPVNSKHIGLLNNSKLVAILSYKQNKNTFVIQRFCQINNTKIVGGGEALVQYLETMLTNKAVNTIQVWVDLRYENGSMFESIGFIPIKEVTKYKWADNIETYNTPNAKNTKKYRIYDAGQRLYSKTII
jgi:hypothetical protein